MNKQEIEKALSWVKEVINHQVFERATYEDTYGTGDLSEEERKEVYEEMDNNINLFKTIQCALTRQLNNGWIPVSERLPEPKEWCWVWFDYDEEGHSSGNGFCEKMYLSSNGKWMKNTLSTVKDEYMDCIRAWQPYFEPEPYKEVKDAERN